MVSGEWLVDSSQWLEEGLVEGAQFGLGDGVQFFAQGALQLTIQTHRASAIVERQIGAHSQQHRVLLPWINLQDAVARFQRFARAPLASGDAR